MFGLGIRKRGFDLVDTSFSKVLTSNSQRRVLNSSPVHSACSSSQSAPFSYGHGNIKQLNDAVYELYKPATGSLDLEIVFFHGFQSQDCRNAYVETWMSADHSACGLNSWLTEKFPQSRVLSISYDSSVVVNQCRGKMDMHVVEENLAMSLIELARVGQTCPVVLVWVLEEVCCRAEKLGAKLQGRTTGRNPYNSFLYNTKEGFFYSTCQMGSQMEAAWKPPCPLLTYYKPLTKDSARLNEQFAQLRIQYRWKTRGVTETNETVHDEIPTSVKNFLSIFKSSLLYQSSRPHYAAQTNSCGNRHLVLMSTLRLTLVLMGL